MRKFCSLLSLLAVAWSGAMAQGVSTEVRHNGVFDLTYSFDKDSKYFTITDIALSGSAPAEAQPLNIDVEVVKDGDTYSFQQIVLGEAWNVDAVAPHVKYLRLVGETYSNKNGTGLSQGNFIFVNNASDWVPVQVMDYQLMPVFNGLTSNKLTGYADGLLFQPGDKGVLILVGYVGNESVITIKSEYDATPSCGISLYTQYPVMTASSVTKIVVEGFSNDVEKCLYGKSEDRLYETFPNLKEIQCKDYYNSRRLSSSDTPHDGIKISLAGELDSESGFRFALNSDNFYDIVGYEVIIGGETAKVPEKYNGKYVQNVYSLAGSSALRPYVIDFSNFSGERPDEAPSLLVQCALDYFYLLNYNTMRVDYNGYFYNNYQLSTGDPIFLPNKVDNVYYSLDKERREATVMGFPNYVDNSVTIPSSVTYNGASYDVKYIKFNGFYMMGADTITTIRIVGSDVSVLRDTLCCDRLPNLQKVIYTSNAAKEKGIAGWNDIMEKSGRSFDVVVENKTVKTKNGSLSLAYNDDKTGFLITDFSFSSKEIGPVYVPASVDGLPIVGFSFDKNNESASYAKFYNANAAYYYYWDFESLSDEFKISDLSSMSVLVHQESFQPFETKGTVYYQLPSGEIYEQANDGLTLVGYVGDETTLDATKNVGDYSVLYVKISIWGAFFGSNNVSTILVKNTPWKEKGSGYYNNFPNLKEIQFAYHSLYNEDTVKNLMSDGYDASYRTFGPDANDLYYYQEDEDAPLTVEGYAGYGPSIVIPTSVEFDGVSYDVGSVGNLLGVEYPGVNKDHQITDVIILDLSKWTKNVRGSLTFLVDDLISVMPNLKAIIYGDGTVYNRNESHFYQVALEVSLIGAPQDGSNNVSMKWWFADSLSDVIKVTEDGLRYNVFELDEGQNCVVFNGAEYRDGQDSYVVPSTIDGMPVQAIDFTYRCPAIKTLRFCSQFASFNGESYRINVKNIDSLIVYSQDLYNEIASGIGNDKPKLNLLQIANNGFYFSLDAEGKLVIDGFYLLSNGLTRIVEESPEIKGFGSMSVASSQSMSVGDFVRFSYLGLPASVQKFDVEVGTFMPDTSLVTLALASEKVVELNKNVLETAKAIIVPSAALAAYRETYGPTSQYGHKFIAIDGISSDENDNVDYDQESNTLTVTVDENVNVADVLSDIATAVNAGAKNVENIVIDLATDIDISEAASTWSAIGTEEAPFTGTLSGNGHTLTGLASAAGAFFGVVGDEGRIDSLFVDGTVSVDVDKALEGVGLDESGQEVVAKWIGLLAGVNNGTMSDVFAVVDVDYDIDAITDECRFSIVAENNGVLDHVAVVVYEGNKEGDNRALGSSTGQTIKVGQGSGAGGSITKCCLAKTRKLMQKDASINYNVPECNPIEISKDLRVYDEDAWASGEAAYWFNFLGEGYSGEFSGKYTFRDSKLCLASGISGATVRLVYDADSDNAVISGDRFANLGSTVSIAYDAAPLAITGASVVLLSDSEATLALPKDVPADGSIDIKLFYNDLPAEENAIRNVFAAGRSLTVFDVAGRKVGSVSSVADVRALRAGLYVAKALNGESYKLLVK